MEIEQTALLDFLKQTPPLDTLSESSVLNWLAQVEIEYFRQGETILQAGETNHWLYLLRSGSVQVLDSQGEQVNVVAEGEWFGYRSLLEKGKIQFTVKAQEDCLVYLFPKALFLQAYRDYPIFQQFFARHKPERIRLALQQWQQTMPHLPLDQPVQKFIRPIEILPLDMTLQQAAQKLQQAEKNPQIAWPVLVADERFTKIAGKLLVSAVAKGVEKLHQLLPLKASQILQPVMENTPVGEVLSLLVKNETVLVVSEQNARPLGIFSLHQLPPALDFSALTHHIAQAQSFDALASVSEALPTYFQQLVMQKLPPKKVSRLISALGEALTQKVVRLTLSQQQSQTPELANLQCTFLVAGSMARGEQTLKTDQDNAMLLPDGPINIEESVLQTFSQTIVDQLNQLGYEYCPGEMMASNSKWRQPVSQWQRYFRQWTETPTAEAVLLAATFYDLKPVCGANELFEPLHQQALDMAKHSGHFLYHLAANALSFKPPIGFFRNFMIEKSKDATLKQSGLDLKKRGITPIVELARVYALSEGLPALNTWDRLQQAQQAGIISQQGYEDLRDALDLIAQIRQHHQAQCIEQNLPADNIVSPETLSHLEQRHLKDAFTVVREMQDALALKFNL
ncbi:putative nucleotidyltransferase substrate binding domain-containing protein [Galenea microaerophila]